MGLLVRTPKTPNGYYFYCPACRENHYINSTWTITNMGTDRLTVNPSIKVEGVDYPDVDPTTNDYFHGVDGEYLLDSSGRLLGAKDSVCHLFIVEGKIQYLGDCTHKYAGKTVSMIDIAICK